MPEESVTSTPGADRHAVFPTTHWSVVLRAGDSPGAHSQEALARLCETYRPPILAYARGLGLAHADAEDITQSFFLHFLQKNLAGRVEQRSGVRFRSFLLRCFKNFLADERSRSTVLKRGGGQIVTSLDELTGPTPSRVLSVSATRRAASIPVAFTAPTCRSWRNEAEQGVLECWSSGGMKPAATQFTSSSLLCDPCVLCG